ARSPAAASARTSACASPARWCQPSPTVSPSFTRTQPTRGLGEVLSRPRAASASARAIARWSVAEQLILGVGRGGRVVARAARTGLYLADDLGELVDVGEVAIHRGEADVGDLVQYLQLLHHQFADLLA